ncbi:MAG: hypothetical protein M3436_01245 [Pseudomonadota bacterium]|nr:hypothetical protein [Pseudomonadota bacterium]
MTNWRYVALLHNLQLEEGIGNEYIAVVPSADERLSHEQTQSGFRTFVSRFRDQFGRKVCPSVLIVREDVKRDLDLLVGFRNALALTAVVQAWMKFLSHGAQLQYFNVSDYFSLYPYVLINDGQHVFVNSPALLGLDGVEDFHGQTTPGIPTAPPHKAVLRRLFARSVARPVEEKVHYP